MYILPLRVMCYCIYVILGAMAGTIYYNMGLMQAVLRIHDILGRIRIRGSMPLTNGSGPWIRILLFSSLKMPAKYFCLLLFEATFT